MNRLYLDHNATTPVAKSVQRYIQKNQPYFGNPSAFYHEGRTAKHMLETGRLQIAQFLNTTPDHLVFTGSGTESNNHVLQRVLMPQIQDAHFVTTAIEHSSILATSEYLKGLGLQTTLLPVSKTGHVSLTDFESSIQPNTKLVSVMMVNNEVGSIQPIQEMGQICKARGVLFHVDAVQAFGKLPISCKDLDVDFLSMSAHKIYNPKGLGVLVAKDPSLLSALIWGGKQEQGLRSGTENVMGVAALGDFLSTWDMNAYRCHVRPLRDALRDGLRTLGGVVHAIDNVADNTVSVGFDGVDGQSLAINLDLEGIAISTGSACSTGAIEKSHVLTAMGLSESMSKGTIRIGLGMGNTDDDVSHFLHVLKVVLNR